MVYVNHDERHCECTESDDWSSCKDNCMWNPSTCDYDCNKPRKTDDYSDIQNNKNRGKVIQNFLIYNIRYGQRL